MTLQNATQQLISHLSTIYEEGEAMNIAGWVMEKLTDWGKIDRFIHKEEILSDIQQRQLEQYTTDLLHHCPVQYVLGEAWFAGMRFFVNENVLIPRPETEELVDWIINDDRQLTTGSRKILDIGTGSGCIPIALKKKFPLADVFACDISEAVLEVASLNSRTNGAAVQFIQCNILDKKAMHKLPQVDIIVSNPPYIPLKDKETMHKNVLDHEPHLALFVPDEDPLLFYRTIAELVIAKKATTLYLEIHEEQGNAVVQLLKGKGFTGIEIKKDMQGKDRMIKAFIFVNI